jgi:DNA-binding beta-propeller fold protein YncE
MNNLRNTKMTAGVLGIGLALACFTPTLSAQEAGSSSILGHLGSPTSLSTVPPNGDLNPYGVAFVPPGFPTTGALRPGDILVSNYNNAQNLQGTGTTIVRFHNNQQSVFFQGQAGLGLSTGLAALKMGYVLVGNMPTTDGTSNTVQPGSLMAINTAGQIFWTYTNTRLVDGPWDFTVNDQGSKVQVFVSNVLEGTISRIDLSITAAGIAVKRALQISSGYTHRPDPAALEVGPTGLAYDAVRDILYVAGSDENAIYAIPNAGAIMADGGLGYRIYMDSLHLHGALAMILATNGHLICSNSDVVNSVPGQPSELDEFTVDGKFVAQYSVDPAQGGAFGLNIAVVGGKTIFAAVDDNTSSLNVFTVQ